MNVHTLKTDPMAFEGSIRGEKTYEIRFNDRDFRIGDLLVLEETTFPGEAIRNGAPLEYTGRVLSRIVTYVGYGYGLQDGWVILGVRPV